MNRDSSFVGMTKGNAMSFRADFLGGAKNLLYYEEIPPSSE